MSMIPRALCAVGVAVFTAGLHAAPAFADVDFSGYTPADPGDYVNYGNAHYHRVRPVVYFRTSSDGSGFVCAVTLPHNAACSSTADSGGALPDAEPAPDATLNAVATHRDYTPLSATEGPAFNGIVVLPRLSKLVFDHMPGPEGSVPDAEQAQFEANPITCGTGGDGSVSCATEQGHGFTLSHEGNSTW